MGGFEIARNLALALLLYGAVMYLSGGSQAQQDLRDARLAAKDGAPGSTAAPNR